ncbi:MAG: M23 family metallopeptidase [Balneola sp.]|jgi:murein DD-endopeptidase MepM/ murein hydrolase activator NlpD
MRAFIKRLFKDRHKTVEIILLDDSKPGQDDSYKIKPNNLFMSFTVLSVIFSVLVAMIFMLTPLGGLLYNTDEIEIRREIQGISERLISLQDSLDVRDQQLREIKEVIRLNKDTTLTLDERLSSVSSIENSNNISSSTSSFSNLNISEVFESGNLVLANVIENAPDFPTKAPAEGTRTRGYEPLEGHFGIDIATKANDIFMNIADGTVISSSWTMDFGYVISVQHKDGLVSTYKHCSKLYKTKGEKVFKGDVLGLIGNTGISSSGPHLHFEIWKNGVSQNPLAYLIF